MPVMAPARKAVVRPLCRLSRRLGGADVGAHRDVHADIAGDAREEGADHEADRFGEPEEEEDQHRHGDADHRDGGILAAEIGFRALLNGGGDIHHLFVAGRGGEHLAAGDDAVEHCGKSAGYGDEHDGHLISFP
jgi:hypothetical protein